MEFLEIPFGMSFEVIITIFAVVYWFQFWKLLKLICYPFWVRFQEILGQFNMLFLDVCDGMIGIFD